MNRYRKPLALRPDPGADGIRTAMVMAAGLGMNQMQAVTHEIIDFAREKLGEEAVGEIVGSIPGIGQFV